MDKDNTLQDRIRGSFIGGAAGDALGFPVEFFKDFREIQKRYGENGITKLTPPWSLNKEKSMDTRLSKILQNSHKHACLTAATVILLSLIFAACKGNTVKDENRNAAFPNGTSVEAPDNLVAYFDSLLRYTPAFIYTRNVDDVLPNPDSLAVLRSIKALDDFQAGRSEWYPREQVADALGSLVFAQWHNGTHGDEEEEVMAGSEFFFFHYLEQAARLCPHVDYLTSIHTGDDKAGIFTGNEFSIGHQPYYHILLYHYGSGYRTKFLQHFDGYNRIRELTDQTGRNYLLCYNINSDIHLGSVGFKAILFLEQNGDYEEVCANDDWLNIFDCYDQEFSIDYNPKTMTWTRCLLKDGEKIPVSKMKRLRLSPDGKNSRFELCD